MLTLTQVLALLEFGCDPSTPNNEGWTPLTFAARGAPKKESQPESWLQLVEALLLAKADTAATTSKGFQPLHYACASNHAAAVRVLLQRGANKNIADNQGYTALAFATSFNHSSVVSVLLEALADPNVQDEFGITPLIHAAARGHSDEPQPEP